MTDPIISYQLKAAIVLGTCWAAMALLSLWAVWGRGHWLVRQAVVLAAIWVVELTGAMPLVWFWLGELIGLWLVRGALALWRWRFATHEGKRNTPIQFRLLDLFSATMLAAMGTAITLGAIRELPDVKDLAWTLVPSVIVAQFVWRLFSGKNRLRWRVATLIGAVALSAPLVINGSLWQAGLASILWWGLNATGAWFWFHAHVGGGVLVLVLGLAAVWPIAFNSRSSAATEAESNGRKPERRIVAAACLLLIFFPPLWLLVVLAWPLPTPEPPLAKTNAYERILAEAVPLRNVTLPDADVDSRATLGKFATSQVKSVDTLRSQVQETSFVPLDYTPGSGGEYTTANVNAMGDARQLSRALVACGDMHAIEGRHAEAAQDYLAAVRLGPAVSRQGLLIDHMVGTAIESMGALGLMKTLPALDAAACREVAVALAEIDDRRESMAAVTRRDQLWESYAFGWQVRLEHAMQRALQSRPEPSISYEFVWQKREATTRLLLLELALRAHTLERGTPSETLAELTPEYLRQIPLDPYSGAPFIYRRAGVGYLLYSVGPNLQDDGGQIVFLPDLQYEGDGTLRSLFGKQDAPQPGSANASAAAAASAP